jgi:hypothetical protein
MGVELRSWRGAFPAESHVRHDSSNFPDSPARAMHPSLVWIGGLLLAWLALWGLGGARTYPIGAMGAFVCTVLIGPGLIAGFYSLRKMLTGDRQELADEVHEIGGGLAGLGGLPVMLFSPMWAFMVLAAARALGSWNGPMKGGWLHIGFAVLALHLLVWGAMSALCLITRDDD